MPGALRNLFVNLKVNVDDKELKSTVKTLSSFMRTLNRLKKINTKKLEKSIEKVDKELDEAGKSSKKLDKNIDKAGKSTKKLEKGAEKSKKEFKGLNAVLTGVSAGIAAAAVQFGLSGLRSFIRDTMESTNQLARWAGRLQLGVRELESWTQLSSQFGADIDDVTDVFKELQLKARDALDGTKTYIDVFKLIGISTDDLAERINSPTQLMDLFTDRLTENTDAATQNFVADELMSDAGTRMIEVLRMGTTEITRRRGELLEQNEATTEMVRVNRLFSQELAKSAIMLTNIRNRILVHVLPILTRLSKGFDAVIGWFVKGVTDGALFEAVILAIGIAFGKSAAIALASWLPVIATWAFFVVGIIAATLLLEDLIVTIQGGDSAIKSFLESIGLWDGAIEFIDRMGRGIDYVKASVLEMIDIWDELLSYFAPTQQFLWSLVGIGESAEEITGSSRTAEARRQGARSATANRNAIAETGRAILPGIAGDAFAGTLHAAGASERGRSQRRQSHNRMFLEQSRGRSDREANRTNTLDQIRTADQSMFDLFGPESGSGQMSVPTRAMGATTNVSQNNPTTITVNGTTDPREVALTVAQMIRRRENENYRQAQTALVPEESR